MKRHLYLFQLIFLLAIPVCVASAEASCVKAIGMTVSDMDRSVQFYSALTFQKISDREVFGKQYEQLVGVFGVRMRIVRMQLGTESIELTEYLTPVGRPVPADSHSNDLWFQHLAIVVSDMNEAFEKLRGMKVQFVSTAPQRLPNWNKAAGGIEAFYFRDPDQHNLELIYFPPGKGDPRWQTKSDKLFLGIDHTAIAISDTSSSLHFYRDLLGFNKAGESENYGSEQEHLSLVRGAHLRITGMRAERGPGVEFLEYLAPKDGRRRPDNSKPNDIFYWNTILVTSDFNRILAKLDRENVLYLSSTVISLSKDETDSSRAVLIADPDGHGILLTEEAGIN